VTRSPFWGGAVGILSYESAAHVEPKFASSSARNDLSRRPSRLKNFRSSNSDVFDAVAAIDLLNDACGCLGGFFAGRSHLSPVQLERLYRQGRTVSGVMLSSVQISCSPPQGVGDFSATDVRSNRPEAAYQLMAGGPKAL